VGNWHVPYGAWSPCFRPPPDLSSLGGGDVGSGNGHAPDDFRSPCSRPPSQPPPLGGKRREKGTIYQYSCFYLLSSISYLLSPIFYLLSSISYLLSPIFYLLSSISYLLSTISSPLPPTHRQQSIDDTPVVAGVSLPARKRKPIGSASVQTMRCR